MDVKEILKEYEHSKASKQKESKTGKRVGWILCAVLILLLIAAVGLLRGREIWNLVRFGVHTVHSPMDADGDFIDDYTDLMLSARRYVRTQPEYVSAYFRGGYPPEGQGVCTDVIWRALADCGYDFKTMLDRDIAKHPKAYPLPNGKPDVNIDFRRVVNLQTYFERHGQVLTTDPSRIGEWQPGDFVFYDGHVAVISDIRNADGQPWIIHHTGHGAFEEDALTYQKITGHYRWTGE
jgi:uncharacterized protein YijF (DUF1287 family)